MKKVLLVYAVICLTVANTAWANVTDANSPDKNLHGAIGTIFTSKYIWRGFEVYGSKTAIHPYVNVDLFGSGFGIDITAHHANASDNLEEGRPDRWDYNPYYHGIFFPEERYAIMYRIDYVYYNYPQLSSHTRRSVDLQEINGVFSFPNLIGIKGLVPSYVLVKLWPSNSDSPVGANSPSGGTASGFAHIFMLDYALTGLTCPITGEPRTINLHSEIVYNDGVSPNGMTNVDHDWSDAVFGASTDFKFWKNFVFTPGIYYQISMEKTVNPHNELWASLDLKYKF
jgi:hypothetical protein